jgi:pyruvate/2-oxoacid:ferredoxin oxidoreductase beta subunit
MSYADDHDEALKVAEAMETYGGSFVQALAVAIRRADSNNLQKIKETWPDYWKQYKETSEKEEKE